jgi:hypothetical protein
MRCAYHPDRDAVGACVNCGKPVCSECRTLLGEKIYCGPCANQLFVPKPAAPAVPAARSGALTVGAVLNIIAGGIGVIAGLVLISHYGLGLIFLVPSAVAILGGAYALERRNYRWALAGAICALVPIWILGIPAIILIAQSKKEFT